MTHLIPLGIDPAGYGPAARVPGAPFRVGFLARVAPEKGLHLLAESYVRLRRETDFGGSALEAAGYLAPEHRGYLHGIERRMKEAGLAHEFHYRASSTAPARSGSCAASMSSASPAPTMSRRGSPFWRRWPAACPRSSHGAGRFPRSWRRPAAASWWNRRCGEPGRRHLPPMEKSRLAALGAGAPGCSRHFSASQMAARALEAYQTIAAARPMLEISQVGKQVSVVRGPLTVLASVSLTLHCGEAAAIMGPSGSGKSTLLYIVGGLEPPSTGRVTLDGVNPYRISGKELAAFRNQSVGFVFQDHCLLPQCSVLENVLVPTLVNH